MKQVSNELFGRIWHVLQIYSVTDNGEPATSLLNALRDANVDKAPAQTPLKNFTSEVMKGVTERHFAKTGPDALFFSVGEYVRVVNHLGAFKTGHITSLYKGDSTAFWITLDRNVSCYSLDCIHKLPMSNYHKGQYIEVYDGANWVKAIVVTINLGDDTVGVGIHHRHGLHVFDRQLTRLMGIIA